MQNSPLQDILKPELKFVYHRQKFLQATLPIKKKCDDPLLQLILSTVLGIKVKEAKILKYYFQLVQKDQFLVYSLVSVLFIEIKY